MPLQKLVFKPGVNRENTNYGGEGGWFESDKVRFRSGWPEKIGGWSNLAAFVNGTANSFKGVARSMWNWITLTYDNLNAVGTSCKVYVENGGAYNDITPRTAASPVSLANNPFATTSGSTLVTVTASAHGTTAGTYVTFAGASTFNGVTISGEYEIITVPDGNSYTIISATSASGTGSGGGASVTATYDLAAGLAVYTVGNGWGAGAWSRGGWGSAATVGVGQQLRLWTMDNYGQDLILAPRGGDIYYWVKDVSTYARCVTLESLATAAGYDGTRVPNQTLQVFVSDTQRFVICLGANPYDPTTAATTFDPMLVRWADQDNAYEWVPAITNQAGEFKLSNGSTIVAGFHARQENLIYTDSALFVMQYLGPPYVWGFNLIADNISIMSPQALAAGNNLVFWMGVDKFYVYNGRVDTLPSTLRQYVFGDFNYEQAYQVVAGSNEGYSEVWWMYPSANSPVNDRYVIYNYLDQVWYYGTINRTAWLDSPLRQEPMGAFSVKNSYLSAAITSSQASISLVDSTSYPSSGTIQIGSEIITYTGNQGNTLTGCTRGASGTTAASHSAYAAAPYYVPNQVMYHEVGVDDGSLPVALPIEAYIGSSDFDIGDGYNFGFVWRIIPDLTFDGSTVNQPQVTMTVRPRQFSGSDYGSPDPNEVVSTQNYVNQRNYLVQKYTGQVYTRLRGRQMSFKVASNTLGVTWQLGAPRIDIRPDGRR